VNRLNRLTGHPPAKAPELMDGTRRTPVLRWPGRIADLAADGEARRLVSLMALFFLVVCAVGILRPIKNSLALDGLGATDFYKVYLVSAIVVAFVPAFNRLARRLPWGRLFALVALFFASNLVLFRVLYTEGSSALGLAFYGWYDLFAAALVTQFFMVTQLYFDARSARKAFPLVIAGGSIGATIGGAITGFFAESLGTPNLLLVAAALIAVFAAGIPWVLAEPDGAPAGGQPARAPPSPATLQELLADRQVRLIAAAVLLAIVVKQLVDYQYNVVTKEVFVTRDAISAFQGKFNAATQWLPLVVLAGLQPALRRWGVAVAVLLLPMFMLATTAALALTFGLVAAVAAKGAETSLRYSAERAAREILYVPVRPHIKLQAKAWIDIAIEKGVGKVLSAVLIMLLLTVMDYRDVAWVAAGLAVVWVALALALRRQYVRTLATSIEGRFASLQGLFASLVNASTVPILRREMAEGSPLRAAFALELLDQAEPGDLRPMASELNALASHDRAEIRHRALSHLCRAPELADADLLRARLYDEDESVRELAVRVMVAASGPGAAAVLNALLRDESAAVRTAALRCVAANGQVAVFRAAGRAFVESRWDSGDRVSADSRAELALAAGSLHGDADAALYLAPFLDDDDAGVRSTALRSAGLLGRADCCARMIAALADPATREAARAGLVSIGAPAVDALSATLLDPDACATVRRLIPSIMAGIPAQQTVDALLHLVLAPETDQLLDYRTLKALSKLRAREPGLVFDPVLVWTVAEREAHHAARYMAVRAGLGAAGEGGAEALLPAALDDGVRERREGVFRCLGLLHDPAAAMAAFTAVTGRNSRDRGNALEWIEQVVGSARSRRLAAVLEPDPLDVTPLPAAALADDGDAWIAHLARMTVNPSEDGMELIEKVFMLQQVDLLRGMRGAHLALLASISDEVDVAADTVLLHPDRPPEALYIVTRGAVELRGAGERMVVERDGAFGTWALIDNEPSPLEARALERTGLMRITRTDFHDLLADHSEIAVGLLQGLARRVRELVA
jgi:ATP:ADP antiporter, AAA family